jgi:hypothetical protein
MALLNVHPDYMHFQGKGIGSEEYPARFYEEFLHYIRTKHGGACWHALPRDVTAYVRDKQR